MTPSTDAGPNVICTSQARGPFLVVLVGAGGTGARVAAPLSQMLRASDYLALVDHDIVEDRNLARQNFIARDIGRPKAEVLADRYRRRVSLSAFTTRLTAENGLTTIQQILRDMQGNGAPMRVNPSILFVGCVDNAAARSAILTTMRQITDHIPTSGVGWVDVGNETRGGQVLLTTRAWPMMVRDMALAAPSTGHITINGLPKAMPQLLRAAPAAPEESCADRIDLQTVMVNHLASSAALNVLSWLTLGIPFVSCGAFFSTLNTMQPIRLLKLAASEVLPDTTFASTE